MAEAAPPKPPKPSKPPRLPHCAVFCRTSKRRVRCSPEPPKPTKPPKPPWRLTPLKLNPPFPWPWKWRWLTSVNALFSAIFLHLLRKSSLPLLQIGSHNMGFSAQFPAKKGPRNVTPNLMCHWRRCVIAIAMPSRSAIQGASERDPNSPDPKLLGKITKDDPKFGPPPKFPGKNSKKYKKCHFEDFVLFFFFVFCQVILGVGHFGSFLVIFEYFRVRGLWVSLTGAWIASQGWGTRWCACFWFWMRLSDRCGRCSDAQGCPVLLSEVMLNEITLLRPRKWTLSYYKLLQDSVIFEIIT